MTRVRAVVGMGALRLSPDAEIKYQVGMPVKDADGNQMGTIVGVRTHPDGLEIEFELTDPIMPALRSSGPYAIDEESA